MKQAPEWFVKAMKRIDPDLHVFWHGGRGCFRIIRLGGARSRSGKTAPISWRKRYVHAGGDIYKTAILGTIVIDLMRRDGIPQNLDEIGGRVLAWLRQGDTWIRGHRTRDGMDHQHEKHERETNAKSEGRIRDIVQTTVDMLDCKVDMKPGSGKLYSKESRYA